MSDLSLTELWKELERAAVRKDFYYACKLLKEIEEKKLLKDKNAKT